MAKLRHVGNRLGTVWADKAEVYRRRGLQLDFQQLLLDVRELSVVRPCRAFQAFADGIVQEAPAVPLLVPSGIGEGLAYQLAKRREEFLGREKPDPLRQLRVD